MDSKPGTIRFLGAKYQAEWSNDCCQCCSARQRLQVLGNHDLARECPASGLRRGVADPDSIHDISGNVPGATSERFTRDLCSKFLVTGNELFVGEAKCR